MRTLQRRITCDESTVSAELDEEIVLLNVETGLYFGLDAVGARIWTLLGEGVDSEECLAAAMLEEYDVEPAELRADLAAFLDRLIAKGLARVSDGDDGPAA